MCTAPNTIITHLKVENAVMKSVWANGLHLDLNSRPGVIDSKDDGDDHCCDTGLIFSDYHNFNRFYSDITYSVLF